MHMLALPPEILSHIVDCMVPPVMNNPRLRFWIYAQTRFKFWIREVSHLARTCRTFRDIAYPRIWHHVRVTDFEMFSTLLQNLHLCRYVKSIICPQDDDLPATPFDFIKGAEAREATKAAMVQKMAVIEGAGFATLDPATRDLDMCIGTGNSYRYVFTLLLVRSAESLRELGLTLSSRPLATFPPGFFPHLRSLGYESGLPDTPGSLSEVDSVVQAAPYLTAIYTEDLRSACLPCRLDRLHTLSLYNCKIPAESLVNLTHNAPRLHDLEYVQTSGEMTALEEMDIAQPNGPALSSAFAKWRSTLQRLSIYLDHHSFAESDGEASEAEDEQGLEISAPTLPHHRLDFSSLGALESLKLACVWLGGDVRPADMLPSSLRTLELGCHNAGARAQYVRRILDDIGHFPSLETIKVTDTIRSKKTRTMLHKRGRELGIQMDIYDPSDSSSGEEETDGNW